MKALMTAMLLMVLLSGCVAFGIGGEKEDNDTPDPDDPSDEERCVTPAPPSAVVDDGLSLGG